MSMLLPVNINDLLNCSTVESERVEFVATWDQRTTGVQVIRTICAFANDYHNLNGGYVVIGAEGREGRAVLPPVGLSAEEAEDAWKWIRGNCDRLDPAYQPIVSPEMVEDRLVLIVRVPASEMRPHRVPGTKGESGRFWIRLGAETADVEHRGDLLRQLIEQTARVPWDDRRAEDARIEDLREAKVREYLHDACSGLLNEVNEKNIYRRMRIVTTANNREVPRNVGLLFFSRDPEEWFRGAKIEVVHFAADRAGDVQEERVFGGALADQLRDCLNYLKNSTTFHLQKQRNHSRARGGASYPFLALRETLVNAVQHRSYDVDQPEPTKVYIFPGRIEITSYPGPVEGIEAQHLLPGAEVRPVPARNRRIGEFLKELRLAEGRLTGLRKVFQAMEANGSPPPRFDFDEQRTYFRATLRAHPEYVALSALRDAAHLRALGETAEALRRIESAWESNRESAVLASELVRTHLAGGEIKRVEEILKTIDARVLQKAVSDIANMKSEVIAQAENIGRIQPLLQQMLPLAVQSKRYRQGHSGPAGQ